MVRGVMEGLEERQKIHLVAVIFIGIAQLCNADVGSREDAFVGYTERPYRKVMFPGVNQGSEYLIFATKFGGFVYLLLGIFVEVEKSESAQEIKVELATVEAPTSVNYIKVESLVTQGLMDGCSFYRAEPAGPTFDEGRDLIRPGYALVQGGLYSCGRQETKRLPVEASLNNTKGAVSLITGTSEFFFNLEAHPEWDGSFSVFGKVVGVQSWNALSRIVANPTRQEAHSSGTILRMLINAVPFKARLERPNSPPKS